MKHTISTALRRIAELKGDIARFKGQMTTSAHWMDDNTPAFSYEVLEAKYEKAKRELVELKSRVAVANSRTRAADFDLTLQQLVFELSEVKDEISYLSSMPCAAKKETVVSSFVPTYTEDGKYYQKPVSQIHHWHWTEQSREEKLESLRSRAGSLNAVLEHYNHTTEI